MGIGNARIREMLRQTIGGVPFPHLEQAYRFSEQRLQAIASAIENLPHNEELRKLGCGYAAIGSLGRMEATAESDADIILLCPSKRVAKDPAVTELDQEVRRATAATLRIKVSEGKALTSPTSIDGVADVSTIGGSEDNVEFLTKRILLLVESRPLTNAERTEETRRGIFKAYANFEKTKGKH